MKSRYILAEAAFGMAGVLAGCSGADKAPAPAATAAVTVAAPGSKADRTTDQLTADGFSRVNNNSLGDVWFGFEKGTSKDIAAIQYSVGATANLLLVSYPSFPVVIDGQQYDAKFSLPPENVIRAYGIYKDSSTTGGSATNQSLTPGPNGQLTLTQAIGKIGQENTGPGFITNATTELCQGLDLTVKTPNGEPVTPNLYTKAKEGGCNSLGYAADKRFIDWTYEQYKQDISGVVLGAVAGHGAQIQYTLLDPTSYGMLSPGHA